MLSEFAATGWIGGLVIRRRRHAELAAGIPQPSLVGPIWGVVGHGVVCVP